MCQQLREKRRLRVLRHRAKHIDDDQPDSVIIVVISSIKPHPWLKWEPHRLWDNSACIHQIRLGASAWFWRILRSPPPPPPQKSTRWEEWQQHGNVTQREWVRVSLFMRNNAIIVIDSGKGSLLSPFFAHSCRVYKNSRVANLSRAGNISDRVGLKIAHTSWTIHAF